MINLELIYFDYFNLLIFFVTLETIRDDVFFLIIPSDTKQPAIFPTLVILKTCFIVAYPKNFSFSVGANKPDSKSLISSNISYIICYNYNFFNLSCVNS